MRDPVGGWVRLPERNRAIRKDILLSALKARGMFVTDVEHQPNGRFWFTDGEGLFLWGYPDQDGMVWRFGLESGPDPEELIDVLSDIYEDVLVFERS